MKISFLIVTIAILTALLACGGQTPTPGGAEATVPAPAGTATSAPAPEPTNTPQAVPTATAGQSYDSRTNSNSGAPKGTRSPSGNGLPCLALRTI